MGWPKMFCCSSEKQADADKKEEQAQQVEMVEMGESKAPPTITVRKIIDDFRNECKLTEDEYNKLIRTKEHIKKHEFHALQLAGFMDKDIYKLNRVELIELTSCVKLTIYPISDKLAEKIEQIADKQYSIALSSARSAVHDKSVEPVSTGFRLGL